MLGFVEILDAVISSLVGDGGIGADSLSPTRLAQLLSVEAEASDQKALENIQSLILQKGVGTQLINGHTQEPQSFAVLGQRFVWSSFIFSRLVSDHVPLGDGSQKRRIPSAVDVAFTLFGNDSAAEILADRMNDEPLKGGGSPEFVPFRDGIPFSSNLVALRQLMDKEFDDDLSKDADDKTSISMLWQRALRALSRPSPNASPTFQSNVWRLRQMNTQLGSFTQLRHDTLLYTKKGSTMQLCCEYADGMVDPYPVFWQRMGELAQQMSTMLDKVLAPLIFFGVWSPRFSCNARPFHSPDSEYFLGRSRRFFKSFAKTMKSIEEIASLQTQHQPLCETQVNFLKTVMKERFGSGGSKYEGWYPGLFFESREDSGKSDVIVVDVHTDLPSPVDVDPGSVLHLGVGNPLMAFFVVDNTMFAGPVFSSYEFLTPSDQRLTDEEFERKLPAMEMPEWQHQSHLCLVRSIFGGHTEDYRTT